MPVSNPVLLEANGSETASTSQTTSTFSPTGGSLLCIGFLARDSNAAGNTNLSSTSIIDTFTGTGAWAEAAAHVETTHYAHILAYAQLGASPGAGAIRVDFANSTGVRKAWIVFEISGHSTVSPLSESTWIAPSTTPSTGTIVDIVGGNLFVSSVGTIGSSIGPDADLTMLSQVVSGPSSPISAIGLAYDPNDNQTSGTFTSTANGNVLSQVLAEFAQNITQYNLERMERHYPRGHMRGFMRGAIHFSLPRPQPQLSAG